MEFARSDLGTIGVEVEYGIIDSTGSPAPVATDLLRELGAPHPDGEHPHAKHELFQSTVEVITGVCRKPSEAIADLEQTLAELYPWLDARGLGLVCTGTHPFAPWHELAISPKERYHRLTDKIGWPAKRLGIHGIHVHVGIDERDAVIPVVNALNTYVPLLLALSCSSPYWNGRDTSLASTRTLIFQSMPTTGLPPHLADWAEFETLLDSLIRAETIETVREIWWDIRPHPGFGTVELRMCDGIPTLVEVAAITALAQALVIHLVERWKSGAELPHLPEWALRENKWRAARNGLDGELIVDAHGRTSPLRDLLHSLIVELGPTAERVGSTDELGYIDQMLEHGASYERQRRLIEGGMTLPELVLQLSAEQRQNKPGAISGVLPS